MRVALRAGILCAFVLLVAAVVSDARPVDTPTWPKQFTAKIFSNRTHSLQYIDLAYDYVNLANRMELRFQSGKHVVSLVPPSSNGTVRGVKVWYDLFFANLPVLRVLSKPQAMQDVHGTLRRLATSSMA